MELFQFIVWFSLLRISIDCIPSADMSGRCMCEEWNGSGLRTVNWLFNPGGSWCSSLVFSPSSLVRCAAPFNQHLAPCFTNSLLPSLRKRKDAPGVIYYEIGPAGSPGASPLQTPPKIHLLWSLNQSTLFWNLFEEMALNIILRNWRTPLIISHEKWHMS